MIDIQISEDDKEATVYVDNSGLDVQRSCRYKNQLFQFENIAQKTNDIDGDSDRTGKSPDLWWGSSWHKAMDAVWRGADLQEARKIFTQDFKGCPDDPTNKRTLGKGGSVLAQYFEQFGSPVDKFELISPEMKLEYPIHKFKTKHRTYHFIYRGLVDKVVRRKLPKGRNRPLEIVDHKTTSWGTYLQVEVFSISRQFYGYMWLISKSLGERPKTIWIDLVHLASVNKTNLHREPVTPAWGHILEWKKGVQIECEGVALDFEKWEDGFDLPMDTGSCSKFNKPCPYLPLCKESPKTRKRIVSIGYEQIDASSYWNER